MQHLSNCQKSPSTFRKIEGFLSKFSIRLWNFQTGIERHESTQPASRNFSNKVTSSVLQTTSNNQLSTVIVRRKISPRSESYRWPCHRNGIVRSSKAATIFRENIPWCCWWRCGNLAAVERFRDSAESVSEEKWRKLRLRERLHGLTLYLHLPDVRSQECVPDPCCRPLDPRP